MNQYKLNDIINNLENNLDNNLILEQNSELYTLFKQLIEIICLDNNFYNSEIIHKLDILTDNIDSLNFGLAKENINELKELLK